MAITAAASGGASGDAFGTQVSTPTWSAASAYRGSLGMNVATGAARQVEWQVGQHGTITDVWGRFYFRPGSIGGVRIAQGDGNVTANFWRIALTTTTGTLNANINGGTNVNTVGACTAGSWCRVEYRYQISGGTAIVTCWLFLNPDSNALSNTGDMITQSGATTETSIPTTRIGLGSSLAGGADFDEWAEDATGPIGPVKRGNVFIANTLPRRTRAARL